jgi:hypothetical protein
MEETHVGSEISVAVLSVVLLWVVPCILEHITAIFRAKVIQKIFAIS